MHSGWPSSLRWTNPPPAPPPPPTLPTRDRTHPLTVEMVSLTPSSLALTCIAAASCSRSTSDKPPLLAAEAAIFSCKSFGSVQADTCWVKSSITASLSVLIATCLASLVFLRRVANVTAPRPCDRWVLNDPHFAAHTPSIHFPEPALQLSHASSHSGSPSPW